MSHHGQIQVLKHHGPHHGSQPQIVRHSKRRREDLEAEPGPMIRQPETRPISHKQLVAEVKGIYAGLVMVESKCIDVDNSQNAQNDTPPKLDNEQWQALINLHRTLLHEHHDFFLASQHPSAAPTLRRLASKYAMPARMWRHGIHSFLELLRHRLPQSLEHMLTFIYLAYSMMALLYETVPAFEDTWVECLGDLGRYRMAIEDDDIRDREVWCAVSRHWYTRASEKAPTTYILTFLNSTITITNHRIRGRLYHHLAILARPNVLQQLFYYEKSLCVAIPFPSARDSILTLFDPILNGSSSRLSPIDILFVKIHAILFTDRDSDKFWSIATEFTDMLDNHIRSTRRWLEPGSYIAITNCCSILNYGSEDNVIIRAIRSPDSTDITINDSNDKSTEAFIKAKAFNLNVDIIILARYGDPNVLPYVHARLAFLVSLMENPAAKVHLDDPWDHWVLFLNSLLPGYTTFERMTSSEIPRPGKGEHRPLPEDWALRGLIYAEKLYPPDWFLTKQDDDEKHFEIPSMADDRKERVLWLAYKLVSYNRYIAFDNEAHTFSCVDRDLKSMSPQTIC